MPAGKAVAMRGTSPSNDHPARRAEIVSVAATVFYDRGFTAGTTREIAAAVGLTQPAIYHYVGAKDDLLGAIAQHVDREMNAALARGLAWGSAPRERLIGIIEEFTSAVLTNQKAFAVYYREHHHLAEELRTSIESDERLFVRRTSTLVRALQETGGLPSGDPPTVVAEAILGMASWSYRWFRPGGRATPSAVAAAFVRLIGLDTPDSG